MKKERVLEILILIIIAIAVIWGANKIYYEKFVKPNLYTIAFFDMDSIIKGSPVRFMGIIVGHVRNLKRQNDKILCEIIVTKPHVKIPDGAVAKVEFNGLGGSKSIEIMPPASNNPGVKGILTAEALRISDFMDTFKNLQEVLACIKGFIEGLTPESTLAAAEAISHMENLGFSDKALDEIAKKQQKNRKMFAKISNFEKYLDGILNRFQKF